MKKTVGTVLLCGICLFGCSNESIANKLADNVNGDMWAYEEEDNRIDIYIDLDYAVSESDYKKIKEDVRNTVIELDRNIKDDKEYITISIYDINDDTYLVVVQPQQDSLYFSCPKYLHASFGLEFYDEKSGEFKIKVD